jgi:hypothetical protein
MHGNSNESWILPISLVSIQISHHGRDEPMSYIPLIVLWTFGLTAVGLFHADVYFPIWLSVSVLAFLSYYLLQRYRKNQVGLLMLLVWLVFAMPFIHIPPYMWFDFSQTPILLWGLVANPYMTDHRVIELTAMIGAVGGLGVLLGVSLSNSLIVPDFGENPDGSKRMYRTMALPIWLFWVAIGVVLTALSAPKETVFEAAYTQSVSALDTAHFDSAWMMSYVILSFAFCDTLLEHNHSLKNLKVIIIGLAIVLVIVYFQLLRGDRESIPWAFGLALVYYYWAAGITKGRGFRIPWLRIFGVLITLLVTSVVVGAVRSGLANASLLDALNLLKELNDAESVGLANALHGTWSGVLMTPLSVAGDHIYGLLPLKWGKDYLNLFLSIVPGFVADAFGYIRPLDAGQGPSYEMRYGLGGTHSTVVPFMNFGMLGVFLGPAIWSSIITSYEKSALHNINVIQLSLLTTIAMASPHWLWYGEKYGINAIILWIILSWFYRLSLSLFHGSHSRGRLAPGNDYIHYIKY